MSGFVKVHILDVPYHVDRSYDYYLPDETEGEVRPGTFVTVPFGPSNRRVPALVTALSDSCEYERVKPVLAVNSDRFALDDRQLELCAYLKKTTLCTVGEAARTLLPTAAFSGLSELLLPGKGDPEALRPTERAVYDYVRLAGKVTVGRLKEDFGESAGELVARLCRRGFLLRDYAVKEPTNEKFITVLHLAVSVGEAEEAAEGRGPRAVTGKKQRLLLAAVIAADGEERGALLKRAGCTSAQLKALEERGLIRAEKIEAFRNPYADIRIDPTKKNILSDAQRAVWLRLCELFRSGEPKAALLFGVTGSGKTRVIKAMIDEVTGAGKTVILLVPEISLTPQTVSIFCSFYGERVAVLHSALSAGERLDAYKRIRSGTVDVVIGTRSAVFAPLPRLGMIVLDEEQEHTYKSDTDPKYHARDVARFRCAKEKALMLLCSATPSVESFRKAKTGQYELLRLTERYGGAKLPEVRIADMREELRSGNTAPFSRELLTRLEALKTHGEQAIVFLNRRGYNSFELCMSCGETVLCPSCSVPLARHREKGETDGRLLCHYCGYTCSVQKKCPSCGSDKLTFMGCGTQQAEAEINRLLPELTPMRMDADTTATKEAYNALLSAFRAHRADVLLGTQMVAKGHDFPLVTLVGVLNADASLSLGDYRANERTFSLITQVVGRAGRAERGGVAVVQTFKPDNEALRLACRGDYEEFYEAEIKLREAYLWPPFCDLVLMTLSARDEDALARASERLSSSFGRAIAGDFRDVKVIAFGPFEAPIYKLADKYRLRMVVKCRLNARARELFSSLLCEFGEGGAKIGVTLSVDFNPSGI
ncbi:MAG: primosomal protein N' [Eubacteriales bacterium]